MMDYIIRILGDQSLPAFFHSFMLCYGWINNERPSSLACGKKERGFITLVYNILFFLALTLVDRKYFKKEEIRLDSSRSASPCYSSSWLSLFQNLQQNLYISGFSKWACLDIHWVSNFVLIVFTAKRPSLLLLIL